LPLNINRRGIFPGLRVFFPTQSLLFACSLLPHLSIPIAFLPTSRRDCLSRISLFHYSFFCVYTTQIFSRSSPTGFLLDGDSSPACVAVLFPQRRTVDFFPTISLLDSAPPVTYCRRSHPSPTLFHFPLFFNSDAARSPFIPHSSFLPQATLNQNFPPFTKSFLCIPSWVDRLSFARRCCFCNTWSFLHLP